MILDKNDVSASMHRLIVLDKKNRRKGTMRKSTIFPDNYL